MALYLVASLFGTLVAETILASVHVRAHQQAGHMDASDLIKAAQMTLREGARAHRENEAVLDRMQEQLAKRPEVVNQRRETVDPRIGHNRAWTAEADRLGLRLAKL